ncbi:tyrosine-type recombinase/integrase [Actinomyces faecalis]|uniref:tyrosine-type recombinase/integrase n=1 Tax=Actinomyces faecalis TaxID=2722820 RepID=UPI00155815F4|nr:site-specific integrase [Actinomyces faecalis]
MPKPAPHKRRDGSTVFRVRFRVSGSPNPVCETFNDLAEAKRFATLVERVGGDEARRARTELAEDTASDIVTLAEAVEEFIDWKSARVTPGTVRRYRQIARDRLNPQLGNLPVTLINRRTVARWLRQQRETPIARGHGAKEGRLPSAKTLKEAQALLSAVLEYLAQEQVITHNPAKGVRPPDDSIRREKVFLTPGQFAHLLKHIPKAYQPLVASLYGLGLRFGEATALTPADLDLEAAQPVVRVTKAWKEGEHGRYLGAPKTRRGIRTVTVPPSLLPVLREQVEKKRATDLLFPGPGGDALTSGTFHRLVWQPAVKAAGMVPVPRVHDLRHSHASALIAAGIPLPVIQRRLGHESIQTTVDVYGHLAPEAYAGAASAIDTSLTQALPEVEAERETADEVEGEVLEECQVEVAGAM